MPPAVSAQPSFEEFFDAAPTGMIVSQALRDAQGHITDFRVLRANPAALRLTGVTPEDVSRKTILQIDPSLRSTGLFERYVAVTNGGGRFEVEHCFAGNWYSISYTRVGDGFMTTFVSIDATRQARQTLEEQAVFLQTVLDHSPVGIVVLDAERDDTGAVVDFRYRSLNPEAARLSGHPAPALVGRLRSEVFPGIQNKGVTDVYTRVYLSGEPAQVTWPYDADGLTGWFRANILPHGDGLMLVLLDVTDTRQAELALEQEATLLNHVMDASLNGIAVYEPVRNADGDIVDFRYTRVNETMARARGQRREHLEGRLVSEVTPAALGTDLFRQAVQAYRTDKPYHAETFYPDADVWLDMVLAKADGHLLLTYADVTDRKKAEEKNRRQADLTRDILDATPLAINHLEAVFDERGEAVDFVFRVVNPASERIGRRSAHELIGNRLTDMYPHTRDTGIFDRYVEVWKTGEPWLAESFYAGDGLATWFSFLVTKHADGLVTVINDISDHKRVEEEANRQAELANAVLNAALVGISTFEAVRDEAGTLVDLRYASINETALHESKLRPEDVLGKNLTGVFPGVRESGLFERYRRIIETGTPERFELQYAYDDFDNYTDVQAAPFGPDGLIINYAYITERKRAELRQTELTAQLRAILDNTPVGVALMRSVRNETGELVDLEWTLVNDSTARTVLLPGENMTGKRLLELFPNVRTMGAWDGFYKKTVDSGVPQLLETYYEGEGLRGWFRLEGTPHDDGMLLTLTDITDRKQAELDVQQQASTFNGIINSALNGLIHWLAVRDEAGIIVDLRASVFNQAGCDMARITPEQFRTRTFLQLDPEGLFPQYVRVIETGEPLRTEYFFEEINTWFDVTAAQLGDGLVVSFSNVTPLKQAEQTQQRLADEYRHILDNALTAISHFTSVRDDAADGRPGRIVDFRYESFNHMAELITGRRADEIVGRRMLELFPGVATSGVFDRWVQLVEGDGQTARFQDRYQLDGFDFWFDTQAVKWGDGFIQSYVDVTPIKQAEQAQTRQAELFNQVINTSLNGILLLQPVRDEAGQAHDFRVRLFNQAAHDLTGLPWEWAQTRTLLQMNESIGTSGLLTGAVGVLETGEPLRVEFFFEPVNRWFDVAVARLDDELVVTFSDISSVRESVIERQRHGAQQQALLDGSINAILACEALRDEAGTLVDFTMAGGNRAVEVMLNRPLSELVGQNLLEVYPGNVESGSFRRYKDTVEIGRPQRFEMYYNHDGLDTWFDVSTAKNGDGLIISFLDVSEAKRAQQALVGESILFQALSSHVPETGVLVCNPSKRILFANGEMPAIFNRADQRHLPEKYLGDVLRFEYRTEVMAAFRAALSGQPQQTADQYGDAYFEGFYSPVENAEGQIVMALATFRNVTRDRLYQQQLKQSNENLERFAYVASHDLQEPLRKIQSFGDMLFRKQKDRLDESGLDLIRRMQASAERMNELIRDLLTYSRVSSTIPEFSDVALTRLLADVRSDLDLVIREKSATLRVDPLPLVSGDALQLRQLFQNLLSNALKFTRPDVPPVVEVHHRPVTGAETEAMLLLQPDATYHEISISDNGIGFDEQYADRIFEAFQRLHGRAAYPGTGIGLAIVKKVVENHRGGLSVSSRVGAGSTFRVYLPVNEEMG